MKIFTFTAIKQLRKVFTIRAENEQEALKILDNELDTLDKPENYSLQIYTGDVDYHTEPTTKDKAKAFVTGVNQSDYWMAQEGYCVCGTFVQRHQDHYCHKCGKELIWPKR